MSTTPPLQFKNVLQDCVMRERQGKLTETALPLISLSLISLIKSSTLIASGRSFLFARTSNGTEAKAGRERREWSSEVAVGTDLG